MAARPPSDFRGETNLSTGFVMAKKSSPPPDGPGPRTALIALKCRQEYKDWVTELAREYRITPTQIIDRALVAFAKAEGRKIPPER
jgi:hypothetical protein